MAAETITVLFTDLVGSTDLLSRVGEATADELRREHFALLRAALAEHGGREIKNLGDGLMVVFEGTAAAVSAAVAMQQAITGRSASAEPLSVKIGIAAGDAEAEDGDYFGLPVVEAARLCARAGGGEILTTVMVRMLARSRSTAVLELVGSGAFDLVVSVPLVMVRPQLNSRQWAKIDAFLAQERGPGRPPKDTRQFIEAVLWWRRTGVPWRDLPDEFGPWKTVFNRFDRWSKNG